MIQSFNEAAFPSVQDEKEIAIALKEPLVKGVIYHNGEWAEDNAYLQERVQFIEDSDLASQYRAQNGAKPIKIAGSERFDAIPERKIIDEQTAAGGVVLNNKARKLITRRVEDLSILYARVYKAMFGEKSPGRFHQILATPKGGMGRSRNLHVDNLRLTLHSTFAGAGLGVHQGVELAEHIWDALDKGKVSNLSEQDANRAYEMLVDFMRINKDQFAQTPQGAAVFLKGQKGLDLSQAYVRAQMPPHGSSAEIAQKGQLAALIYHGRLPS